MNLSIATLFLVASLAAVDVSANAGMGGSGFYAQGIIDFDSSLEGNTELIGAHLHTGSATTNGPVNVIFCGSAPLPDILGIEGPCAVRTDGEMGDMLGDGNVEGRFVKSWGAKPTADLATQVFTNGANNATSVEGATTLSEGAPTTFDSFQAELMACTVDECNVYFNIHTRYSFELNAGAYGLARAQLSLITCEKDKLKMGYQPETAKCFIAMATSNNTNLVDGIPNQLAPQAGAIPAGLLVVYQGGTGSVDENPIPVMNITQTEGGPDNYNSTDADPYVNKFSENNQPNQQGVQDSSVASLSWLLLVSSLLIATITVL
mmetsp:Transcript_66822/g.74854  ORF Transcript_66822/g.74854 Transcript_66822/m.74854 type:complete len:319 (+) Transcript_66822:87-1043(+)